MTKYNTTKAQMFATVIAIVEASEAPNKAELVERLNHEVELITKKSTSKANTEKTERDKALTEIVLAVLADNVARTVTEIQTAEARLSLAEGVSNSKVTALLRPLVESGKVVRTQDKKKSYYSLA